MACTLSLLRCLQVYIGWCLVLMDFMRGIEEEFGRAKQELQDDRFLSQRVNAHCRDLQFKSGDLVLLSTKKLGQPGPSVRNSHTLYGFF